MLRPGWGSWPSSNGNGCLSTIVFHPSTVVCHLSTFVRHSLLHPPPLFFPLFNTISYASSFACVSVSSPNYSYADYLCGPAGFLIHHDNNHHRQCRRRRLPWTAAGPAATTKRLVSFEHDAIRRMIALFCEYVTPCISPCVHGALFEAPRAPHQPCSTAKLCS